MNEPRSVDLSDFAARQQALAGWQPVEAPPSGLIYRSRGRILLIGGETALLYAPRLLPELQPQVLVTDDSDEPSVPSIPLAGRSLSVDGHLGQFRVELGQPGERDHEIIGCDIILDLAPQPQLQRDLPPPGYYRPGDEPLVLDALIEELKSLRGEFEKPKFFVYDPAACAHARSGVAGCNRCIEACPAEAISDAGDGIEVNPMLCQGGGTCAAVCPSGAIGYALPTSIDLQERIRQLIRRYRELGGQRPVLLLQAEAHALPVERLSAQVLPVVVEELASVGLELLLGALAYGAGGLRYLEHPGLPPKSRQVIDEQMRLMQALLSAQGYDPELIGWMTMDEAPLDVEYRLPASFVPANFAALGDKRQRLFQAIDHLHGQAPKRPPSVSLEAGAPFGTVTISEQRCTLCQACTSACPAGALQAAGEQPGIRFIEASCLQCGICTATCPEDAIWTSPRLLFDRNARREARMLHQEPPFACVRCGKPFATRRIIDTVLERLQGNPMFATEQARQRLQMCEDCRVIDMAHSDPEQLTGQPLELDHD